MGESAWFLCQRGWRCRNGNVVEHTHTHTRAHDLFTVEKSVVGVVAHDWNGSALYTRGGLNESVAKRARERGVRGGVVWVRASCTSQGPFGSWRRGQSLQNCNRALGPRCCQRSPGCCTCVLKGPTCPPSSCLACPHCTHTQNSQQIGRASPKRIHVCPLCS